MKIVKLAGQFIAYHGGGNWTDAIPQRMFKYDSEDIRIHFGTYEQAEARRSSYSGQDFNVRKFQLTINRPLYLEDVEDWRDSDQVIDALQHNEVINEDQAERLRDIMDTYGNDVSRIRSFLKSKGYDGIVYQNDFEGNGDSYIIFDASQAKCID